MGRNDGFDLPAIARHLGEEGGGLGDRGGCPKPFSRELGEACREIRLGGALALTLRGGCRTRWLAGMGLAQLHR